MRRRQLKDGDPAIFELELTPIFADAENRIRKYTVGEKSAQPSTNRVVLIIGETGSGKTTLIHSISNFMLNVNWKDPVRYKLIVENEASGQQNQAISQTQWITGYTVYNNAQQGFPVPYDVTIIDTPVFGDSEELQKDRGILDQLKHFFANRSNGIDDVDAIGIAVPSPNCKLNAMQKLVLTISSAFLEKTLKRTSSYFSLFPTGMNPPHSSPWKPQKFRSGRSFSSTVLRYISKSLP